MFFEVLNGSTWGKIDKLNSPGAHHHRWRLRNRLPRAVVPTEMAMDQNVPKKHPRLTSQISEDRQKFSWGYTPSVMKNGSRRQMKWLPPSKSSKPFPAPLVSCSASERVSWTIRRLQPLKPWWVFYSRSLRWVAKASILYVSKCNLDKVGEFPIAMLNRSKIIKIKYWSSTFSCLFAKCEFQRTNNGATKFSR